MIISELITQLEKLKESSGDLPVYLDQEKDKAYSYFEVGKVQKIHLYKEWLDSKNNQPDDIGLAIALKR